MAEEKMWEQPCMKEGEALQMLQRVERLKKLMGTPAMAGKKEKEEVGFENQREKMIFAAIPFLDREYQKDLYLIVRLMELQRVLGGDLTEARGKAEEPPQMRQRKLLGAVQEYLPAAERQKMQQLLQMMDMKAILEGGRGK